MSLEVSAVDQRSSHAEPLPLPASEASVVTLAVRDLAEGLHRWELWGSLGWLDIKQRYRRSTLGPFWITLSLGAMVLGLSVLWSTLFKQSIPDYLPYFTVGFIVWSFLSSVISEGCMAFCGAEGIIKQIPIALSVHVFRTVWRNVIITAHNLLIYLVVLLVLQINPGWALVYAIPAIFLLILFSIGSVLIVGILSARFRDIPPLVTNLLQMIFFFSPILWMPSSLSDRKYLLYYNPFYYLLDVLRLPLLGNAPGELIWVTVVAIAAATSIVGFLLFARYRTRVAYWV